MTEKLSDQSLNLKTNFMRTRNYLLIICLFLTFCQGCVKELHELPPRPGLVVKLNGIERDSIISILVSSIYDVSSDKDVVKGIMELAAEHGISINDESRGYEPALISFEGDNAG